MTLKSASSTQEYKRSVSGWILDKLTTCDAAYSGFLRRYIFASPLRVQAIALVLSQFDIDRPEKLAAHLRHLCAPDETISPYPLALISHVLLNRRVKDILRTLYPDAKGMIGVLTKLGNEPIKAENYGLLIDLCTHAVHRPRVAVLRHAVRIPEEAFAVLFALERPYITLNLVKRFIDVGQVRDFYRAVELIKRVVPRATDSELISSLIASSPKGLRDWALRWLAKAEKFWVNGPPLDGSGMVILGSAAAMREAARRYKNCLETKIGSVALGRVLYLECLEEACIVELENLNIGWGFVAIFRKENMWVSSETARIVLAKLASVGVSIPHRYMQAARYNCVARLAAIHDFSRDDLFDDELPPLQPLPGYGEAA